MSAVTFEEFHHLDDGWHRFTNRAKEFQANGPNSVRLPVQDKARRSDNAVAAFFLDAGQSGKKFVRDILAQTRLPEPRSWDLQHARRAVRRYAIRIEPLDRKARHRGFVDFAKVVPEPRNFDEAAVWIDHAPGSKIVERGSPENGLFAASVHGNISANARCVRGRRIHRKHQPVQFREFHHALGNDAGATMDCGHIFRHAR